jgi:hypothetical protein
MPSGSRDAPAIQARRTALRAARAEAPVEFVFGPERAAYEARTPGDLQEGVMVVLQEYPGAVRPP